MNAPVATSTTRPREITSMGSPLARLSKTCRMIGYAPNAGPRKNTLKKSSNATAQAPPDRAQILRDRLYRTGLKAAYWTSRCFFYVFRPRTWGVNVALWCPEGLLVIRNSYKPELTLPGGYRRAHENPLDTAVRETAEEVGIQLSRRRLVLAGQLQSNYEYKRETVTFFEYNLGQRCDLKIDRREVIWADFVEPARIPAMPCSPHLAYYLNFARPSGAAGSKCQE